MTCLMSDSTFYIYLDSRYPEGIRPGDRVSGSVRGSQCRDDPPFRPRKLLQF